MKKLMAFLCSSLLLGTSQFAFSEALNVGDITIEVRLNENNRIPQGIVWQSSRLFIGSATFSNYVKKDNASIVLSNVSEIGGGIVFWKPNVQKAAQKLPIDLGNGLYLTFLGSVSGTWGSHAIEPWAPTDYSLAVTRRYKTNDLEHEALTWVETPDESEKSGTLSYSLWPVIYCQNSGGCAVPSSSISVQDYYLHLFAAAASSASSSSTQIIQGGTLTFEVGCEFSISPTAFSDIELSTGKNGDILGTRQSQYSASCSRTGSLYVIFTPSNGLWENDTNNRVGLTNLQGIGIVHRNSSVTPTSLNQCDTWKKTKNLGQLQSTSNNRRSVQGTVQWGFYQYLDVPLTGKLDTSVVYEFWVE